MARAHAFEKTRYRTPARRVTEHGNVFPGPVCAIASTVTKHLLRQGYEVRGDSKGSNWTLYVEDPETGDVVSVVIDRNK